jgi:DNA modification methylase
MATTQQIIPGDCIEGMRTLLDASVHCCVTSPPYWGLRNYGHDGQIGLEDTPEAYVARMVEVFREVRRVLRDDGTCWVNLGDSYAANKAERTRSQSGECERPCAKATNLPAVKMPSGLKPKDLVGIPWRVAFALQADGWRLRQDIIWHKPNPMPESVTDRCTKAHEYVFLLTKSERYFYDAEAVKEEVAGEFLSSGARNPRYGKPGGMLPCQERGESHLQPAASVRGLSPSAFSYPNTGTRNRRSVWTISTKPYSGAHFAVMPPDLVEPCIKAGCPEQCCPVCGKGWDRVVERTPFCEPSISTKSGTLDGMKRNDGGRNLGGQQFAKFKQANPDKFLGWQPACDCAASGTIPGTVLDPFAGSGTTLAVAAEQGRSGIGCELNAEYIALAKKRIREARESVALFDGIS